MKQGLIYAFTGEGKGKTSAALGTAMRAVGNGMRVAWVAWYKQSSWKLSEIESLRRLGIDIHLMGKGFKLPEKIMLVGKKGEKVVDTATSSAHKIAAHEALEQARTLLGRVDLIVLDEIHNAIQDGLLSEGAVEELLESRGATHVVTTGRGIPKRMIAMANMVTEMKKVKHPYDAGDLAVRGLDF